jgi:hypothetical protein
VFIAFEITRVVRLVPEELDLIHNSGFVRENRIAELLRPLELLAHHVQDFGKRYERFDAGRPVLLLQRLGELHSLQICVVRQLDPTRRLYDLQRVRRRHQHIGQKIIGIQRDWREDLIKLFF